MFINLHRGDVDPVWLNDLDHRYHSEPYSYEEIDKDNLLNPREVDFIHAKQQEYTKLSGKLEDTGWLTLGIQWDFVERQIHWLMQQDSWCAVAIPFTKYIKLFTRDPIVKLKHKMRWNITAVDLEELGKAIEANNWAVLEISHTDIRDAAKWCDQNCNDIYMFHTLFGSPAAGHRAMIFTDPKDAVLFRMTNTYVCRCLL